MKKDIEEHLRLERRALAESSLGEFIHAVYPLRMLAAIHYEVINFWTRQDAKLYQLLLLPRDHGKSAMIAFRVAWELTKDPTLRILYISSTANLAIKQLKFIKDLMTCDNYRELWPEMIHPDDAKREKWTEKEISVDHPARKAEAIRDPSIFTAGLTTNIVGMHADIMVMDDVVVETNAYTKEGRSKVEDQYGHLSSIGGADSRVWLVGTRYHDADLYASLAAMELETLDDTGRTIDKEPLFEIFQRQVESRGDGTGEFIWPRQQREDGKWFGFDRGILQTKKTQYTNQSHFRAQYYNDPRDLGSSAIQREVFQYYEPQYLTSRDGKWYFKGSRLNVFASVDFAFSLETDADFSAIVVVGVDSDKNFYILEIDRFKTKKISEYYKRIFELYQKWGFRKLRAEVTVGQAMIVEDLKDNYIRKNGLALSIEEYRPSRWQGSKEERILATLEPKYENKQMWHYKGGYIQILEEELTFSHPAHDDIKDALASCVDFAGKFAPSTHFIMNKTPQSSFTYNSKFGGVA